MVFNIYNFLQKILIASHCEQFLLNIIFFGRSFILSSVNSFTVWKGY